MSDINKSTRLRVVYNFHKEYSTVSEMKNSFNFKHYHRKSYQKSSEGSKEFYVCSKKSCKAKMYVLFPSDTDMAKIFLSQEEHVHEIEVKGLPVEAKNVATEMISRNCKPNQIKKSILDKSISPLTITQIRNLKSRIRQKENREMISNPDLGFSYADLNLYCYNNREIPAIEDSPFVISHKAGTATFIMTSRRLISLAKSMICIHIDATYKLIWQDHPVLIFGGSDLHKVFHPYAVAIIESESQSEMVYVLQEFSKISAVLNKQNFQPQCLVSDAATAITNAFKQVFGDDKKVRMCWAHCIRAIDKKLNKTEVKIRALIRSDICSMQASSSEKEFDLSYNLFYKKWNQLNIESVTKFLEYFQRTWINQNKNWYEGYCKLTPATNNCLESVNLRVKQDHSLRERFPLSRFLKVMEDLVVFWSKERNPIYGDCKRVAVAANPSFAQIAKAKNVMDTCDIFYSELFHIYTDKTMDCKKYISRILENEIYNFNNFDEWKECQDSLSVVTKLDNFMVCTCREFLKQYVCMHSIASSVRNGSFEFPILFAQEKIGEKRKRGRPRIAKQGECLLRN